MKIEIGLKVDGELYGWNKYDNPYILHILAELGDRLDAIGIPLIDLEDLTGQIGFK